MIFHDYVKLTGYLYFFDCSKCWIGINTRGRILNFRWKMRIKTVSHVWLSVVPWTAAHQAPPSMGFSRQEHWSGVPLPSAGELPDPGIQLGSPAPQADSLPTEPPGKPINKIKKILTEWRESRDRGKKERKSEHQEKRPFNSGTTANVVCLKIVFCKNIKISDKILQTSF